MEPIPPSPQKKVNWLIILIVIGLVAIIGIMYLALRQPSPTTNESPAATNPNASPSSAAITNDSELQSAEKELDNVDLKSVDSGLNKNDSDSAIF